MKKVYQTIVDKHVGNCTQAAIASLLNLELNDVPNFKEEGEKFWVFLGNFVISKGYDFNGTVYNPRWEIADNYSYYEKEGKLPENRFKDIGLMKGVDGYFFASVYSPRFYDPMSVKQITHAVIIDKEFNIVNPVNKEYEGIKKFPLHDLIGYNGVMYFLIIEKIK